MSKILFLPGKNRTEEGKGEGRADGNVIFQTIPARTFPACLHRSGRCRCTGRVYGSGVVKRDVQFRAAATEATFFTGPSGSTASHLVRPRNRSVLPERCLCGRTHGISHKARANSGRRHCRIAFRKTGCGKQQRQVTARWKRSLLDLSHVFLCWRKGVFSGAAYTASSGKKAS